MNHIRNLYGFTSDNTNESLNKYIDMPNGYEAGIDFEIVVDW